MVVLDIFFHNLSTLTMKKLFCSLTILCFATLTASTGRAQHSFLGARVGANLANESVDSLPSGATTSMHAGFLAGVQYEYWLDDMWSLGVQVLYDQKGVHEDINNVVDFVGTGKVDLTLNYLEIPVLAKVSFGTGSLRPYVFAGPSVGFYLSNKAHLNETFEGQTLDTTETIPDSSINSTDFSIVGGAGVSLKLGSGQVLFVDAAYALGLVNISHNQPGDNTAVKSRDIRLAAGILFPLD